PLFKKFVELSQQTTASYKNSKLIWVEGLNLCKSAIKSNITAHYCIYTEEYVEWLPELYIPPTIKKICLNKSMYKHLSSLSSGDQIGLIISLPELGALNPKLPTVILNNVQNPLNAGAILRNCIAFGYQQVISIEGGASLWGSKSLRAGMGAQFSLHIIENIDLYQVINAKMPLFVADAHQGVSLDHLYRNHIFPPNTTWIFGNEGFGVQNGYLLEHSTRVHIPISSNIESLNVASASAICLYTSKQ
ncbi:MAG: RNA methyltransferase, partial [Gammaproteobacteria bacterium]|nr:RNA methyltransferase [Gammaproteobacteria bacterium]